MKTRKFRMAGAACAVLLSFGLATDALAAETPDSLQQEIDSVLAKTEGGVQISVNEIAWNGGEVIMAFPLPGETAAPPSSPAARELQANVAGLSIQEVQAAEATGATTATKNTTTEATVNSTVDESLPPDETEPSGGATATDSCPTEAFGNDWYCFYQYQNYGGRRLQWNAAHTAVVYFSQYDFVNRTSSWSNKGGKFINVWGRTVSGADSSCGKANPSSYLWGESAHTHNTALPASLDNRADCFNTD